MVIFWRHTSCYAKFIGAFTDVLDGMMRRYLVLYTLFLPTGDSAGGALAGAVALRLRDAESVLKPAAQILIYPWLQALDLHLPAFHQNNQYYVTRRKVAVCIAIYCNVSRNLIPYMEDNAHISSSAFEKFGDMISQKFLLTEMVAADYRSHRSKIPDGVLSKELEECVTNPYNFPLMHDDLADLPPAFILTEEFDALRDDGMIYAKRLQSFDVNVTLLHDRKGFHGMVNLMVEPMVYKHAHVMTDAMVEFIKAVIWETTDQFTFFSF